MPSPLDYGTFPVPPPPPPLPLGRLWWWLAIGATAVALGLAAVSIVFIALWGGRDWPDQIDNDQIIEVIDAECARMTQAVDDLAPKGSPEQVAEAIAAQDLAVQGMLDEVGRLDPDLLDSDRPTRAWIGDWQRFIDARDQIARELDHGRFPDLKPLNDDRGHPIFERMEYAADNCPIPDTLLNPYPPQSANDI